MLKTLRSNLRWIRPLWDVLSPRRRKQLLVLQVISLFAGVGEVANLGALLPFLQILADPQSSLRSWGPWAEPLINLPQQPLLLMLGLGFMAVVAISTMIRVLAISMQLRLAALVTSDLGEHVFGQVLSRPYAWHLTNNTSTVITYLTQDVNVLYISVQSLMLLGMNLLIVLLLGGTLVTLAPGVMITVGLLLTGFYLLVFRFTRSGLRSDGQIHLLSYQASVQILQEGLGGIRDVLLDNTQSFFVDEYSAQNRGYRLSGASINIKSQVPRYLIEGFAMILIVGVSLSMAVAGQGIDAQLPLLGTLALGAYRLLQPLQQCFASVSSLQANKTSTDRLDPLMRKSPKPMIQTQQTHPIIAKKSVPLVALESVSFRYASDSPWVLEELSLNVEHGERLAFVGSTGSGKSTCSDLLLGLLLPSQGTVYVNGLDLHGHPGLVKLWQERVAHVPQHIYLSDASFAANIAFGLKESHIDMERVELAARKARISELIEASSDAYKTMVGERGVRLSGGQRQRIGIARALYKRAELLVLDEATSALDNRTEAEVMEAVEALDRQVTVIMIAHRLTTVERCDRIVVLERGRITGIGHYRELLASHPGFCKLAGNHC